MIAVTNAELMPLAHLAENISIDRNRLVFEKGTTFEQWREAGCRLGIVAKGLQLLIGDWAREGEKRGFYTNSKTYDELAEITGINRRTIQDYKTVADRVSAERHADLGFSHHREVAALAEDQQRAFLQRAAAQGLSARQLRHEIRRSLPPTPDDELRTIQDVNKRLEDERESLEEEVAALLDRINNLPRPYRLKIIKAIER